MPTFAFPEAPPTLECRIQRRGNAPLPPQLYAVTRVFGTGLMPDYYPCGPARLVSCYALFE